MPILDLLQYYIDGVVAMNNRIYNKIGVSAFIFYLFYEIDCENENCNNDGSKIWLTACETRAGLNVSEYVWRGGHGSDSHCLINWSNVKEVEVDDSITDGLKMALQYAGL